MWRAPTHLDRELGAMTPTPPETPAGRPLIAVTSRAKSLRNGVALSTSADDWERQLSQLESSTDVGLGSRSKPAVETLVRD